MSQEKKIYCLTPVFNDWESLHVLITQMEKIQVNNSNINFSIIVVNDGLTEENKI